MLTKALVNETITSLPDTFSAEELIGKIIFLDKVERGNEQSVKGEVISEFELEQQMEKWFE
ncbi:MAG: hypothetical protein ACKVOU_13425 [Cytophagales bacterium]